VEIKCQLDATEVFIADFIACLTCFGHHFAHHQELKLEDSFYQQIGLKFEEETNKMLHLEHGFVWC